MWLTSRREDGILSYKKRKMLHEKNKMINFAIIKIN